MTILLLVLACGPRLVRDAQTLDGYWSGDVQAAGEDAGDWGDIAIDLYVDGAVNKSQLTFDAENTATGDYSLVYRCELYVPVPGHVRMRNCERIELTSDDDGQIESTEESWGEINFLDSAVEGDTLFLGTYILDRD